MIISTEDPTRRLGVLDWRFDDLSGQRFGRLLVLHRDGFDVGGHTRWHAQCDCGQRTIVDGTSLRLGRTRSCRCLERERQRAMRLTNLNFRRAIKINDRLEEKFGVEVLNKIFTEEKVR